MKFNNFYNDAIKNASDDVLIEIIKDGRTIPNNHDYCTYSEVFPDKYSLDEWVKRQNKDCYNIRNVEIYDVLIDITKHETVTLPQRICKGCGKQIGGDGYVTIVEGEYYCTFYCFCKHNIKK